jgi:hypothetical protein
MATHRYLASWKYGKGGVFLTSPQALLFFLKSNYPEKFTMQRRRRKELNVKTPFLRRALEHNVCTNLTINLLRKGG